MDTVEFDDDEEASREIDKRDLVNFGNQKKSCLQYICVMLSKRLLSF